MHTPEAKEKMRIAQLGNKNSMWKGDEAKEDAIRRRLIINMPVPKGFDRHHIDGNVRNSDPSNILVLTRREHMIKDGRMEALIKRNKMWRGRKHSPETIEKLRGRKLSPEHIRKISDFASTLKRDKKGRFLKRG